MFSGLKLQEHLENDDSKSQDWGPFGRPIFEDASARALARVGVVDIGSNSVRLVVFDGAARSPAYFYNEKIMCAIGAGLIETGRLNPQGRARALGAVRRFQAIAEGMGIPPLTAVATAAVRTASDGQAFCDEVLRETGLRIYVIDGQEEARLSAQGVLLGWPEARGVVCDIGGASMELAEVGGGTVGRRVTSDLGPLNVKEIKGAKARKSHIQDRLAALVGTLDATGKRLFLVGGSWRAFARLDMARRGYPLRVLHEYRMTPKSVIATAIWIGENSQAALCAMTGTSAQRMALVPTAAEVLRQLLRALDPKEIAISAYGIREGMLYEQMSDRLRRRDPLIEACRFAEKKDARLPGFGRALYDFVRPLFKKSTPQSQLRIIKAACLLHDVSWRAHPDYRAEVCFDNATRANLGGLDHAERVFLGVTLLHRYKNSRAGSPFEPLFGLISAKELHRAEVLGKSMRLGAMFSVQLPQMMGRLKFYPKKKIVEMTLPAHAEPLFGEVAMARFESLASSLDAKTRVKIAPRPRKEP